MKKSTQLFTDTEINLLRKFYEIEKSMERCGQAEEFITCHHPFYLNLWKRFQVEGVKQYFKGDCKTFKECYETLLWPQEWINQDKPRIQNTPCTKINSEFQSLLSRVFNGANVQILE